ncbi:MAG: abortive infection family protein, partial [Chloroflexota bacterium]|nr:abortive infection family protein [Chloroflexota bacterium]
YWKLPECVRHCGTVDEFWGFIKSRFPTYQERREFLREAFAPAIEYLEACERTPAVQPISETLAAFDADEVHAAWQKALDRRVRDPEGAITAARTLVETVCKHILDDEGVPYADDEDLPKLWHLTAQRLKLAPNQHQEAIFKSILGNCQSVVNNLAAMRNKVGDAHGQGRRPVKPKARHAELAVNLAGGMAAFLVATWQEQNDDGPTT